ncbi:MAG: hypothetical protein ACLP59_00765 [Bryobacteraceae bacterium]
MTNLQLFIAIVVPMLFNGALLALINNNLNQRLATLDASVNARFASIEARLDLLTGKVLELSDRLARVEERLERH